MAIPDARPTDNLRRRATTGAISTGASQAFRVILQFLSVIVLSRLLPPSEFGLMAMISPIIAFALMFSDLGLTQATVTAREISSEQLSTLFWVNTGFAAALTVGLGLAAPLIGGFYGEPRIVLPTVVLASSILITALAAQHRALADRAMRFHSVALIEIAAAALGLVTAIVMARQAPSIWALVASNLVMAAITTVGLWAVSPWAPSFKVSFDKARGSLRFGRGLLGFNLTNFLSRNMDNVLIGRFVGPQGLGYYDRAYKLLLFPLTQINRPIGRVIVPILSRLADEPDRYRAVYVRTVRQLLLFTLPGVAFLLVNADSLVPAVLGEQWRASVPIFIWLGCAALHQPLSATTGWLFVSQSRTGEFAQWGVVVAVTSIAAFLIGLPWGALGVAAAYGLSDLLLRAPIVWIWVGRKGPVSTRDLIRIAWPNAVAVACVLLSQWALHRLPMASSVYVDLAGRAALAYAVAWGVIALIPGGRDAFKDLFQTLSVLRRPAR